MARMSEILERIIRGTVPDDIGTRDERRAALGDMLSRYKKFLSEFGEEMSEPGYLLHAMIRMNPELKRPAKEAFDSVLDLIRAINKTEKAIDVRAEDMELREWRRGGSYGGDPRWITARYDGVDAKGRKFKRGDEILYYPNTRSVLSGDEAKQAWREFAGARDDERFMGGM